MNLKKEGTMNKVQLVEAVAKEAGTSKAVAEKTVSAFISAVTKALKKGDKVTLVGFGTFSVVKKAARTGRNPQTGATIRIRGGKSPRFKPSSVLKDTVRR
ncbi:MAG: HU family DNA-binding protein [Nitrospinota bacterium]